MNGSTWHGQHTDGRYSYVRTDFPTCPTASTSVPVPDTDDAGLEAPVRSGPSDPRSGGVLGAQAAGGAVRPRSDRDEVRNLVDSSAPSPVLERLREATRPTTLAIRDSGLLTEGEMHHRAAGTTHLRVRARRRDYPLARIMSAANLASQPARGLEECRKNLGDADSGVRYWAAMGMLNRGREAVLSSERAVGRTA